MNGGTLENFRDEVNDAEVHYDGYCYRVAYLFSLVCKRKDEFLRQAVERQHSKLRVAL